MTHPVVLGSMVILRNWYCTRGVGVPLFPVRGCPCPSDVVPCCLLCGFFPLVLFSAWIMTLTPVASYPHNNDIHQIMALCQLLRPCLRCEVATHVENLGQTNDRNNC